MIWIVIALAAGVMLLLAGVMAYVLGWARKALHVEEDPRVQEVEEALPGINCGACGYAGCHEYAEAVATEGEDVNLCSPGGPKCAAALANIMGVSVDQTHRRYAAVHCGARLADRVAGRSQYRGYNSCAAANLVPAYQECVYGCLGFGDCERACPYDAIHVIDGLAMVNYDKCTGCTACVKACPRDIISMVPYKAATMCIVACCNEDAGKETRQICRVGCIACGICQRMTERFTVSGNVSHLDYETYDPQADAEGLKNASQKCPVKCLPFRGKPGRTEINPPE